MSSEMKQSELETDRDWVVLEKDEAIYNNSSESGLWQPKRDVILSMFEKLSEGGQLPLVWVCPGRRSPEVREKEEVKEEEMELDEDEGKDEEVSVPEVSAFDFDETMSDGNSKLTPRRAPGGNVRTPRTTKRACMDNIMDSLRREQIQRAAEREAARKAKGSPSAGRARLLNFGSPGVSKSVLRPGSPKGTFGGPKPAIGNFRPNYPVERNPQTNQLIRPDSSVARSLAIGDKQSTNKVSISNNGQAVSEKLPESQTTINNQVLNISSASISPDSNRNISSISSISTSLNLSTSLGTNNTISPAESKDKPDNLNSVCTSETDTSPSQLNNSAVVTPSSTVLKTDSAHQGITSTTNNSVSESASSINTVTSLSLVSTVTLSKTVASHVHGENTGPKSTDTDISRPPLPVLKLSTLLAAKEVTSVIDERNVSSTTPSVVSSKSEPSVICSVKSLTISSDSKGEKILCSDIPKDELKTKIRISKSLFNDDLEKSNPIDTQIDQPVKSVSSSDVENPQEGIGITSETTTVSSKPTVSSFEPPISSIKTTAASNSSSVLNLDEIPLPLPSKEKNLPSTVASENVATESKSLNTATKSSASTDRSSNQTETNILPKPKDLISTSTVSNSNLVAKYSETVSKNLTAPMENSKSEFGNTDSEASTSTCSKVTREAVVSESESIPAVQSTSSSLKLPLIDDISSIPLPPGTPPPSANS